MRLLHTQRSSHSRPLLRPLGRMRHQDLSSALDSPTTCSSSRQRRHKQPVVLAMTRSSCTISRKVCSTRQVHRCRRPNCSMGRNTNRKSHGNRRSNTSSMEPMSCITCNKGNRRLRRPTSKYQHSDNPAPAPRLRHCTPSSNSHNKHNTTCQDKAYQLALLPPSLRELKCLLSIRKPHTRSLVLQHRQTTRPCSTRRSRLCIQHTASSHNTPRRSLNSRRIRSIRPSVATRVRFGRFSRELERETCEARPNSYCRSRSIFSVAPRDLVSQHSCKVQFFRSSLISMSRTHSGRRGLA